MAANLSADTLRMLKASALVGLFWPTLKEHAPGIKHKSLTNKWGKNIY